MKSEAYNSTSEEIRATEEAATPKQQLPSAAREQMLLHKEQITSEQAAKHNDTEGMGKDASREKRTEWTDDLAKLRMERVFGEWKENKNTGANLDTKYIIQIDPDLYHYVKRNHKNIEEYFLPEMEVFWSPQRRKWSEKMLKNRLKDIFEQWKKEGGIVEFSPVYINNRDSGFYNRFGKRTGKRLEDYLTEEMKKAWTRQEKTEWTDTLAKERMGTIFERWKKSHRNGRERINPEYIKKTDLGLYKYIKGDVRRSFEQYFPPGMIDVWHVRVYSDKEGRKLLWTEDNIRDEVRKLYLQWKNEDPEIRKSFSKQYIADNNAGLWSHIRDQRENNFKQYLSDDMKEDWGSLKSWPDQKIREKLDELFSKWEKDGVGKFNPSYIMHNAPSFYQYIRIQRMRFDDYLTAEMGKVWEKQEKTQWSDDKISKTLSGLFETWVRQDQNKGINFNTEYVARKSGGLCGNLRQAGKQIEDYLSNEARKAWAIGELIPSARGFILQYAIEIILALVDNKNLGVEQNYGGYRPDLVYSKGGKPFIFDVKMQTTTRSIKKDIEHYSKIITRIHPEGGYLIFLCLNGPKIPNEELNIADSRIRIKYYHIQKYIELLEKSDRHILRFISDNKSPLTEEKIKKIREINKSLSRLKELVQNNQFSSHPTSLQEAQETYKNVRSRMRDLAKEKNLEKIMKINFETLLAF